jgi:hypothetical protein
LQGIGERDARGVYVDEDLAVTGAWLVDIDDFRGLRAVEPGYLYRAHRIIKLLR